MPSQVRVEISPTRSVTALVYPAAQRRRAGITLILGHGAGAGQTSDFMIDFAHALAARGIHIVTFNFPYIEQGRRLPDPTAKLEDCYRAVMEAVLNREELRDNHLAIGGKSMGGRIASHVAPRAVGELLGLVFLGYPLHPPGRPDRLRAKHLWQIKAAMLFIQGSRDAFGTPDELHPIVSRLDPPAGLYVVEGGDHSFKVPKKSGTKQEDVYRRVQDFIASWLKNLSGQRDQ